MAKKISRNKRSISRDPAFREIIGWQIGEARKKAYPITGSLTKCAKDYGVSPQQWSQYETGYRIPEDEKLALIAKHLKTTVQKLITPPDNWAVIREEWLTTRSKGRGRGRKKDAAKLPEPTAKQVRASMPATTKHGSQTDTPHNTDLTTGTEPQAPIAPRFGSHSSKTMACIQELINVDRLHSEGKISTANLDSTLKSVSILIDSLRLEVDG